MRMNKITDIIEALKSFTDSEEVFDVQISPSRNGDDWLTVSWMNEDAKTVATSIPIETTTSGSDE